jgi:hypothetical protein
MNTTQKCAVVEQIIPVAIQGRLGEERDLLVVSGGLHSIAKGFRLQSRLYDAFDFLVIGTSVLLSDRIRSITKIMVVMRDLGHSICRSEGKKRF